MTKNLMPSSSRAIEATKWADRSHKPSVRDRVGGLPTTGGSDTCGMPHFPHAALNLYHLYRYTPLVEKSASKQPPFFFLICSVSFCQSSHLKSFRIRRFDCNLQNSQMLWKPLTLKLFRERSTYHKTGWVGSSRHQQKSGEANNGAQLLEGCACWRLQLTAENRTSSKSFSLGSPDGCKRNINWTPKKSVKINQKINNLYKLWRPQPVPFEVKVAKFAPSTSLSCNFSPAWQKRRCGKCILDPDGTARIELELNWSIKKKTSCLPYLGDYTTQLYGDHSKPLYKDPY